MGKAGRWITRLIKASSALTLLIGLSGCATAMMSTLLNEPEKQMFAQDYQQARASLGAELRKPVKNNLDLIVYLMQMPKYLETHIQLGDFARARTGLDREIAETRQRAQRFAQPGGATNNLREINLKALARYRFLNGILLHFEGQPARSVLAEMDKIPPGLPVDQRIEGELRQGDYLTFVAGQPEAAIPRFESVLRRLEGYGLLDVDKKMAFTLEAYLGLTWAYIRSGRLEGANALLARYDEQSGDALFRVGAATVGRQRFFRYYFANLESAAGALAAIAGEEGRAREYFDKARSRLYSVPEAQRDPADRHAMARYEILLGAFYHGRRGEHQQALAHVRKGIELFPEHYLDNLLGFGKQTGLIYAAELSLAQGDARSARAYAEQARAFAAKLKDRMTLARADILEGEIALAQGSLATASRHFQASLANIAGQASTESWRAHYGLGRVHEQSGRPRQAIQAYQAAVAEVETLWRGGFKDAVKQLSFLGSRLKVYGPLVRLLIDQRRPGEALNTMEKSKARTLLNADAFSQGDAPDGSNAIDGVGMQRLLARDQGLLIYHVGEDNVSAAFVDQRGVRAANLPITPAELARWVGDYKQELTHYSSFESQTARRLYDLLLRPFERGIAAQKALLIIPHGVLHYLPFQALSAGPGDAAWRTQVVRQGAMRGVEPRGLKRTRTRAGEPQLQTLERYLGQSHRVSYAPSASIMAELIRRPAQRAGVQQLAMLGIGGPPARRVELEAGQKVLASELPFAAQEVAEVGRLFPRNHTYVGGKATETAFKQQAANSQIILLSAHAMLHPRNPARSAVVLQPDRANDGLLTVDEIRRMRFDAKLVALSACETGVVAPIARGGTQQETLPLGDDLSSLHRAFLRAGADSVLSTLWEVDDESTQRFMVRYFEALAQGHGRREALSLAQGWLMQDPKWAHPRYWAAFVLSGRWG